MSAEAMAAALGHSSPVITEQCYTRPESKAAARQQAVLRVVHGGRR